MSGVSTSAAAAEQQQRQQQSETGTVLLTVNTMIRGKLLELNDRLVEEPRLVVDKPLGAGFIAILDPNLKSFSNSRRATNELLASEEQRKILRSTEEWLHARPEYRPPGNAGRVFTNKQMPCFER